MLTTIVQGCQPDLNHRLVQGQVGVLSKKAMQHL
jgi:hypothetical protein